MCACVCANAYARVRDLRPLCVRRTCVSFSIIVCLIQALNMGSIHPIQMENVDKHDWKWKIFFCSPLIFRAIVVCCMCCAMRMNKGEIFHMRTRKVKWIVRMCGAAMCACVSACCDLCEWRDFFSLFFFFFFGSFLYSAPGTCAIHPLDFKHSFHSTFFHGEIYYYLDVSSSSLLWMRSTIHSTYWLSACLPNGVNKPLFYFQKLFGVFVCMESVGNTLFT